MADDLDFLNPVAAFELPDDCDPDMVEICPNDAAGEPPYTAVPYFYERQPPFGRVTRERPDYEPSYSYRRAIQTQTDIPYSDIKTERDIPIVPSPV